MPYEHRGVFEKDGHSYFITRRISIGATICHRNLNATYALNESFLKGQNFYLGISREIGLDHFTKINPFLRLSADGSPRTTVDPSAQEAKRTDKSHQTSFSPNFN